MHNDVAGIFADKVYEIWKDEASLENFLLSMFPGLKPDRTKVSGLSVNRLLQSAWDEVAPGSYLYDSDVKFILNELHGILDYNLFSQVALNLNGLHFNLDSDKINAFLKEAGIRHKDSDNNPLMAKAKIASDCKDVEDWNKVHQVARASSLDANTGTISSRITAIGHTPALSDADNRSMMGAYIDDFLIHRGELKFINWENPDSTFLNSVLASESASGPEIRFIGIDYPFHSKSGGDTLVKVMFARSVLYNVWPLLLDIPSTKVFLRMNSLAIMAERFPGDFDQRISSIYPEAMITNNHRLIPATTGSNAH